LTAKKFLVYYNHEIDEIIYEHKGEYSSNIIFRVRNKAFKVYYGKENKAGNITIDIFQAINAKVKELGWVE